MSHARTDRGIRCEFVHKRMILIGLIIELVGEVRHDVTNLSFIKRDFVCVLRQNGG